MKPQRCLAEIMMKKQRNNFGVTITGGAAPWQIFQQRADGHSGIRLWGEYHCVHLSQELPLEFSEVTGKTAIVKARIAREDTGESVIPWTLCRIIDDHQWEVEFHNVPAGGMYRIETYMEYDGWDGLSCTRGDMIHNIGVGDVFVIAGQSNAAGRAKNPVMDTPDIGVHVLRPSGVWDIATHPLGETTGSIYTGNYENHNPGHSPWLHFAKCLKRDLGYPIGLVPCAYGGAPLRWWNPEENGALFDNMMAMLEDFDIHPKAVLWCQGEAEGYENRAETYYQRFCTFVDAVRNRLNQNDLPFIVVQINRCMEQSSDELDRQWGIVREAQRRAQHEMTKVATVPSADLAIYDFIHDAAQSNLVIGERCANAALAVCYGRETDWQAPEPSQALLVSDNTVRLSFSRIENWINVYDVPAEKLPFEVEDKNGLMKPVSYRIEEENIYLVLPRPLSAPAYVNGMWRMDPGCSALWDCMRMPALSFYHFPVKNNEG